MLADNDRRLSEPTAASGRKRQSPPDRRSRRPSRCAAGRARRRLAAGIARQQLDEQRGVLFEVPVGEEVVDDPAAAVLAHAPTQGLVGEEGPDRLSCSGEVERLDEQALLPVR